MTRDVLEALVENTYRDQPVVTVEDGQVWVSGMNANAHALSKRCRHAIANAGYSVGDVRRDDAEVHGGYLIPVPDADAVNHDVQAEVYADAAGE